MIRYRGFIDFEQTFTIDDSHPVCSITYSQTEPAGVCLVENHNFRKWKLSFTDSSGHVVTFFNTNTVSLKPGAYSVNFSADGNCFINEIRIDKGKTIVYDFTRNSIYERKN
ncbi:MAG: hypothetical protein JW881_15870 [Spirochaetales bacterium]|nr:hypothetical protein [Spirochaetales bacterium]